MFAFKCTGCGADLWSASGGHEKLACPVCGGELEPKDGEPRLCGNVVFFPKQPLNDGSC